MPSSPPFSRFKQYPAFWIGVVIGIPAFLILSQQEINHDTGWFMYAARGMLAGGRLYRDFIDVNAPMAYLSVMPAAALSNIPFVSNEAALAANIFVYIVATYALCAALLRRMNFPSRVYGALCAGFLAIMCFLPNYAFGQREHIFAILTLPYALSAALRVETKNLPRHLAIASGIAAGFAASIKLPYLVVPATIEAAVLLRGKWKIKITADMLAFGIAFAAINLACVALYPVYWTKILASAVSLYEPYDNFWFLSDALIILTPLFLVGFGAGEYRGRGPLIAARWTMTAATLGAFALFIIQRKGWPHHAVPIMITMTALFVLNLADIAKQAAADRLSAALRGGVSVIVIVLSFALSHETGNVDPGMLAGVKDELHGTDGSYYIFSTGNYPAFPLGLDRRYKWTSRFPQLILLPGLVDGESKGKQSEWEPWFRSAVLEDLRRGHPAVVFLYLPTDAGMPDNYDMLGWFRRDPDFDKEWSRHYVQTGNSGPFAVFRRIAK